MSEVSLSPAHREGREQAGASGLGWTMGGVQLHVFRVPPTPFSVWGSPGGEGVQARAAPTPRSLQTDFTEMKKAPQSSGRQGLSRCPLSPSLLLAGPHGRATESSLDLLLTKTLSISDTS